MEKKIAKVADDNITQLVYFSPAQLKTLNAPTPKEFIKQRPGRGGKNFSYVEVGYVIGQLNKAFGPCWDFVVKDKQIGKKQVWVQGELTVYLTPNLKATKSQFGGSDIKIDKVNKRAVDIGDDLKAAASDALKKCASMFGVASDVYFPQLDTDFLEGEVISEEVY